jgi:biopolymer transport protein ExbB
MGVVATVMQGDAISIAVALLLLAMSVGSWVVILWKGWLLRRAASGVQLATAAFWQAADLDAARDRAGHFDPQALLLPLLDAARALEQATPGSLAQAGDRSQQLTRVLRDALHAVLGRLQFGQTLLATVGSTAPFVGLLGTVWGIYHALTAIGEDGVGFRIEQVSGPVGEALVMTAAGLAVAIPAVLAFNVFGRLIARIEADLEGFARDLRELLLHQAGARFAAGPPQGESSAPSGGSDPRQRWSVGA